MAEKRRMIPSDGLLLDARWEEGTTSDAVLLCHPHPLYGGSMDNNVVEAMQTSFAGLGWGTLRFNFRGVGRSEGSHTRGEGEIRDVLGMASHLRREASRVVHLAGYSYGAWVGLVAADQGLEPASLVLISPPVGLMDFGSLSLPPCPVLVTAGDEDEFCPPDSLRSWLDGAGGSREGVELDIFHGCDHFYWGIERRLADRIREFLQRWVG